MLKPGERIDDLQCKGLRIIQDPKRFCFGVDAVFLANFVRAKAGSRVLDLGTGTGIIPILLTAKTEAAQFVGLEIQPESAEMAQRSVALNGLEQKIQILPGDIQKAAELFLAASFDIVTSNPPYMPYQKGLENKYEPKNIARHECFCTLEDVIRAAAYTLKPGGSFFLIHKPFRLAEIITLLVQYKLEPKRLRLIHPYAEKEPNLVMLEAVRGGGSWLTVEPPLIMYREKGVYTEEMERMYRR